MTQVQLIQEIMAYAFKINCEGKIIVNIDLKGFPLQLTILVFEVKEKKHDYPVLFAEKFTENEANIIENLNNILGFLKECLISKKIDYKKLKPIQRTIPATPETTKIIGYYL